MCEIHSPPSLPPPRLPTLSLSLSPSFYPRIFALAPPRIPLSITGHTCKSHVLPRSSLGRSTFLRGSLGGVKRAFIFTSDLTAVSRGSWKRSRHRSGQCVNNVGFVVEATSHRSPYICCNLTHQSLARISVERQSVCICLGSSTPKSTPSKFFTWL